MVGISGETMTSYIHSEFNWPLAGPGVNFELQVFLQNQWKKWATWEGVSSRLQTSETLYYTIRPKIWGPLWFHELFTKPWMPFSFVCFFISLISFLRCQTTSFGDCSKVERKNPFIPSSNAFENCGANERSQQIE